jgi:hypothetical protein
MAMSFINIGFSVIFLKIAALLPGGQEARVA